MSSAIPIRNNNDQNNIPVQFSRNSFAHTPGMGGISWGGASVGSWLRDEVLMANKSNKDHHTSNELMFLHDTDAGGGGGGAGGAKSDDASAPSGAGGAGDAGGSTAVSESAQEGAYNEGSTAAHGGAAHGAGAQGTASAHGSAASVEQQHSHGGAHIHDAHDPLLDLAPTYFPSLEANFCRDYTCCGRNLPTLHDLLRHYEEQHISPSPPEEPPVMRRMQNIETVSTNDVFLPFDQHGSDAAVKDDDAMGLGGLELHADAFAPGIDDMDLDIGGVDGGSGGGGGGEHPGVGSDAGAGGAGAGGIGGPLSGGHSSARVNGAFAPPSFQPLTSSTMGPYGSAQQQMRSEAAAALGDHLRPGNGADNGMIGRIGAQGSLGGLSGAQMPGNGNPGSGFGGYGYGMPGNGGAADVHGVGGVVGGVGGVGGVVGGAGGAGGGALTFGDDEEPTIDDPARQLYMLDRTENKPFKCPVIGCEKTYKNQNGLKYHRQHGHQNQTLHLNEDGTYSIIDPLSNTPYPDGMGMEKDKPYRCEICGKRYKNLNGLKYHRAHSTH